MGRERTLLVLLLCPLLGPADVMLFRYLSDRKGWLSTAYRLLLEAAIAAIARLRGRKVYWLAHNVCSESKVHHPQLNRWRRSVVGFCCHQVMVTEDGLIEYARAWLPHVANKPICACTFGQTYTPSTSPKNLEKMDEDLTIIPSGKSHYFVSVNSWLPKKRREMAFVLELARKAETMPSVHFIIGGGQALHVEKHAPELFQQLERQSNITLLRGWVELQSLVDAGYCQVIVKNYSDLSMSLGMIRASSLGIPVVSEAGTYFGEFVDRYDIGIATTTETDFASILATCDRVRSDGTGFNRVLKANTWERGAKALLGCPPSSDQDEPYRETAG
jgi:glycosyltransferase involved in cell wall biosynthesis